MIEYTFNREIGRTPARIACGPDVNNCCEKANPCAVRRIALPHLFHRRNTQFELRCNKPEIQELLVP
ncbi:hypothetical protein KRR23_04805 [Pseudomonas sp. CVAP|uniref:hypothetical protein n=1 Tax=Pseudomonas sp. CVAP\|nr:hypothetical protein [Pseudomonas sp. CVAP\